MKQSHWIIFLGGLLGMAPLAADLPPPYNTIEVLPFNAGGFYRNEKEIEKLFQTYTPAIVIEVGVWIGKSAMHMASLLPSNGKLYAVDHWLGSEEHQPGQTYYCNFLPVLYEQFLSNIIHAQLTDLVIPIKMTSLEASQHLRHLKADLIYIDASHDFDSVYADLNAWFPLVKGHGILCGDDWNLADIQRAVTQFSNEKDLKLSIWSPCFWVLFE